MLRIDLELQFRKFIPGFQIRFNRNGKFGEIEKIYNRFVLRIDQRCLAVMNIELYYN